MWCSAMAGCRTLHDFTLKIIRDAGVLDSSIRLMELSSIDAVRALADGRIDAAIISSMFRRRWKASCITCATVCARYVSISKARNVTSASRASIASMTRATRSLLIDHTFRTPSPLGHKLPRPTQHLASALPPKAATTGVDWRIRYRPKPDMNREKIRRPRKQTVAPCYLTANGSPPNL
jgi:hypothetical protein